MVHVYWKTLFPREIADLWKKYSWRKVKKERLTRPNAVLGIWPTFHQVMKMYDPAQIFFLSVSHGNTFYLDYSQLKPRYYCSKWHITESVYAFYQFISTFKMFSYNLLECAHENLLRLRSGKSFQTLLFRTKYGQMALWPPQLNAGTLHFFFLLKKYCKFPPRDAFAVHPEDLQRIFLLPGLVPGTSRNLLRGTLWGPS